MRGLHNHIQVENSLFFLLTYNHAAILSPPEASTLNGPVYGESVRAQDT